MTIEGSSVMAQTPDVAKLLFAAHAAIAEVRYCWVVTPGKIGAAHARVVKAFPSEAGETWWTRWFLTRRAARKTAEIRDAGCVTLAFQHDSGEAYVSLAGPAELIDTRRAIERRLQQVDDRAAMLAEQLIAVRVDADYIEIHIRGVTAEPWGHGRTALKRSREGVWCLLPS